MYELLQVSKCEKMRQNHCTTKRAYNLTMYSLFLVAFSSGINAIATGALIDMHTMQYKRRKVAKNKYSKNEYTSSCHLQN
ncbi:MAG: hypothetical protein AOA65_1603 [Candidatus Bathyarchaeota archaeon BA1]|nr:MAG: hypothetical protein AOA65_1603 [Candidatus Bathyarchaeota archaeon BA1]